MKITLDIPDEFAAFLPVTEAGVADVIAAGLHARRSRKMNEVRDLDGVLEMLAGLPAPEEVLALRPPPSTVARTEALLENSRNGTLTEAEQAEWDEILRVEHLVRIAKAKALAKMKSEGRAA